LSLQVRLVDLRAQYLGIRDEIDAAIARVLGHGQFVLGDEVRAFEEAFARYLGCRAVVGVASGTAALGLALEAFGIGPGHEVIAPSFTFVATIEAIVRVGARPVLVDLAPGTFHFDPNRVESAITPRTRAILPVHLFGAPVDMDAIMNIATRHSLVVLEDAAQAHGATHSHPEEVLKKCGSIGHAGCFSFFPGKNLGAYGDGGAIATSDPAIEAKLRRLREHGRANDHQRDEIVEIGHCERLDALQAAVLGAKLPHLDAWNEARAANAARYRSLLEGTPLVLPRETPGHANHLFVVRSPKRDALLTHLRAHEIEARIHYPTPVHRLPPYQAFAPPRAADLEESDRAASEVLSLPVHAELDERSLEHVAATIRKFF